MFLLKNYVNRALYKKSYDFLRKKIENYFVEINA